VCRSCAKAHARRRRRSASNKFTCQPSFYAGSLGPRLQPGTYCWWLVFYKVDEGATFATAHVSGPLQFTVAEPVAPQGVVLTKPGGRGERFERAAVEGSPARERAGGLPRLRFP
jgi:hypothetical protein